ncbi:hypothetical protein [Zavarzinella formosa]|uniref:hypothetical protein n=1 Tax=Zavarzinella formosa TaxID=360055 RepID=UPI00030FB8A5|nr:hypothetical protein [Zavarzinella formosa]
MRMLLVLANLAGLKTPTFVLWLFAHGIMSLFTPLSGVWQNMAESIQRVLKRRVLAGQNPSHPEEIMPWFESVAGHWNKNPTPFVWGGKRAVRRKRQREHRHRVGRSGAQTKKSLRKFGRRNDGHAQHK